MLLLILKTFSDDQIVLLFVVFSCRAACFEENKKIKIAGQSVLSLLNILNAELLMP